MNRRQKKRVISKVRTRQQGRSGRTAPLSREPQAFRAAGAAVVYALERKNRKDWTRYALCGKRSLLERVRDSLGPTEQWRIVYVTDTSRLAGYQKIA